MSYKPESPSTYSKPQIILNSGRLLFNASSDSILMFSKNAIGLSSNGNINFDCNESIINSKKIQLGLNSNEPLLLGNKTVTLLSSLLNQLKSLCESLQNLTGAPAGIPILPVNFAASSTIITLSKLLLELESIKSKQNFTL